MTKNWVLNNRAWVGGAVALMTTVTLSGLPGCFKPKTGAQTQAEKKHASPSAQAGADGLVRVKVVQPAPPEFTPQPAHIEPYEKTDIHAKVSGYLEAVGPVLGPDGEPILDRDGKERPWDIGDRVWKGQMLARLSVPDMEKELRLKEALEKKAQAEVQMHEAEQRFRQAELKRFEQLVKEKSIQEALLDEKRFHLDAAVAAVAAARARIEVAQREKELAQEMLNYATLKAPFHGIITRRLVDTGAFVQSAASARAEPLFTVVSEDRLRIVVDIPEAESVWIRLHLKAEFQPNGFPKPFLGKVARFAKVLSSGTRTMRTEVELIVRPDDLRPGMFGAAKIFPEGLTIPTGAVFPGVQPSVLVVDENGRVERQEIQVGYNDGVRIQILKGLTAQSKVITEGKDSVRQGQTVAIAD